MPTLKSIGVIYKIDKINISTQVPRTKLFRGLVVVIFRPYMYISLLKEELYIII